MENVTDPNGAVVSSEYDALGRRIKVTQPEQGKGVGGFFMLRQPLFVQKDGGTHLEGSGVLVEARQWADRKKEELGWSIRGEKIVDWIAIRSGILFGPLSGGWRFAALGRAQLSRFTPNLKNPFHLESLGELSGSVDNR